MNRQEFILKQEEFLHYLKHEKKLSDNTHRSYQNDLNKLVAFWTTSEEQGPVSLTLALVLEQYINSLYRAASAIQSIARKVSCFNSLKKFLKKQQIPLSVNLKRPLVKLKDPLIVPVSEIFHLMDLVHTEELPTKQPLRDKAILELLYATGIRCSEIVQIELRSIDFTNRAIVIRARRKKERVVLFGSRALERITQYLQSERPEPKSSYERLFLNQRNNPISVRSVQHICVMFRQCMKEKYDLTPHVLRHSFATHMLTNGADVDTLQELLGHKARISTERYLNKITK
ncbi:tyrosine-type recombinase/integrase [Candidatus Dependentiae bacterium]|nr:tyrosine-type recombinase/integrase [Candidatus Dependentiae bacterium]